MTKAELIKKLRQGSLTWNTWMGDNPNEIIDLSGASLYDADLSEANLSGADLSEANLMGANLGNADLSKTNLSKAELYKVSFDSTNLSEANLSEANLIGSYLLQANLNFSKLNNTNLNLTNLSGATLMGADLSGADLSGANLSGADLTLANFSNTKVYNVDFNKAQIGWTVFGDIDLRTTKNLETIEHQAPSHISTSTISRSQGTIPDIFLRGAGLGDTFINYIHTLASKPSEYYTCFISYSSKDEMFARRLRNDLRQEGVPCWFASEDMDIGDKIRNRIETSIKSYDKLLLILSEHSIKSDWVAYEVEQALNKEPKHTPNVLYPVRVDQAILTCRKQWAKAIRSTRHIGNFEGWTDPQQYEESFKRLLRALNTRKDQQQK